MKWLKRSGGKPAQLDIIRLLAGALAREQAAKTVSSDGEAAARPPLAAEEEFRARAQSMLYDFAMQHFAAQVEVLRREAVIDHLSRETRDRLSALRLVSLGAASTLLALGAVRLVGELAERFGLDVATLAALARPIAASIRATAGV